MEPDKVFKELLALFNFNQLSLLSLEHTRSHSTVLLDSLEFSTCWSLRTPTLEVETTR